MEASRGGRSAPGSSSPAQGARRAPAAGSELCACVPPAGPPPLGAVPPRRRGCGTGASPPPCAVSIDRPPRPAPQTQTRRRRGRPPRQRGRPRRPGRSRRAPRRRSGGGSRRDAPGGRRPLTSLGGPAGQGRSPQPGASPAHGPPAPAARPEDRAEAGSRLKHRARRARRSPRVSMAAANLENQLHSAQKNLLFLQREHAGTLKGLHAEIRRLQQHCTDLTYELTLKSSEQTGDGRSSSSSELQRRCEDLEAQLRAKEQEHEELLRELEQRNAAIAVLETTVREREKRYLEELKLKSHKLNLLSGELEQRAGTIAYLTSQLHAAKRKLLSSSGTSDGSPGGSPVLAAYKPAPPRDKLPETPRRRMKKSLSAPLHPEFDEVYRFGAESRKLLLREPVDAMPDPTPFLLARESAEVHLIKERPLVIPPIASDRSSGEKHKVHVGVAHRIHHAVPPAQPEVETLAVDQVRGGTGVRKNSGTDRTV